VTKEEWWQTLTKLEKAIIRESPAIYGEVWETFGPFTVSRETYEGYTVTDYQPHRVEK